eukprot:Seg3589.8 transcript_id=Seg3589.8/GoldUCD/mRNA.D3Y31 product="Zinc finger protein 423" protein_id=Seg3589.8/GoldUCD/D3Y31
MSYLCNRCDWHGNNFDALIGHNNKNHKWICGECNESGTEPAFSTGSRNALREHINQNHRSCSSCGAKFKYRGQLKKHLAQVHRIGSEEVLMNNKCTLCNYVFPARGKRYVRDHLRDAHPNEAFVCNACDMDGIPNVFFDSAANLARHTFAYHKPENTCNICNNTYRSRQRLHHHIIEKHMVHACFFCGNGFRNDTDLYLHQTQHCLKSFKCRYCDSSFNDLRSCQRHELQSHGHFGISTEAVPTLRAQHKFVNYMKYDARPWISDVDEVVSKQGHYMDYVHRIINNSRDVLRGRGIDVSDEGVHNQIVGNAVRSVRKAAIEKVKDAYMKNAASIMTHSTRGEDGQMLTYNIHLVGTAPFNDQIDDILQKVYVENQQNMPYKMAMAFGFFLHTPKTGKYSYWYANTHLSHEQGANGSRSDILQQKDNIWQIRNRSDMDACANDIKNTDFFTLVRNAFEESSTVLVRATNVKVQIFPLVDKSRVINKNLKCLNCGKNFGYVRSLHAHAQKCKFTKSKHCYAKGSVDTSQLLLSKIKQCFAVPDEILPPLSYLEGEERLLHPEENDMYFSKRFATYDFESKLQRTTIEEIRDRRLSYIKEFYAENEFARTELRELRDLENSAIDEYLDEELVFDDDGNVVRGREFHEMYPDENHVQENVPVSYVIAYNFGCASVDEYDERQEFVSSDRCSVKEGKVIITRSHVNPATLIASFYSDLKSVATSFRNDNLHIHYAELVEYLKGWFARSNLILNLDNPRDDIEADDIDEMLNGGYGDENISAELVYPDNDRQDAPENLLLSGEEIHPLNLRRDATTQMKVLSPEIKLIHELRRFLEMVTVLGYNSGKYDIPLIKPYLFHEIFSKDKHPTDSDHCHMIKKGNSYTSVQITNMTTRGCYGFVLKDMREFTGPGGNLRSFMKAFNGGGLNEELKFYWPYDWLSDYDRLFSCHHLPAFEEFWSILRDANVLEEDINNFIRENNLFHLRREEIEAREGRPPTGRENYEKIKEKWEENAWK